MMTGDPCVPCARLVTTHFAPKSNKNQEKVQVQINICHITFYCQGSTHQSSVLIRKLLKNSTTRQTTKMALSGSERCVDQAEHGSLVHFLKMKMIFYQNCENSVFTLSFFRRIDLILVKFWLF